MVIVSEYAHCGFVVIIRSPVHRRASYCTLLTGQMVYVALTTALTTTFSFCLMGHTCQLAEENNKGNKTIPGRDRSRTWDSAIIDYAHKPPRLTYVSCQMFYKIQIIRNICYYTLCMSFISFWIFYLCCGGCGNPCVLNC